jgi:hypothetical protein
MTIEERLNVLEKRVEQVSAVANLPRKPGDISAAVTQAKAAVSDAESRVQATAHASYSRFDADLQAVRKEFAADLKALREEIREYRADVAGYRAHITETIKAEVDAAVVQTLHDYKLLKNGAPSSEYFAHEVRAIVAEELVK